MNNHDISPPRNITLLPRGQRRYHTSRRSSLAMMKRSVVQQQNGGTNNTGTSISSSFSSLLSFGHDANGFGLGHGGEEEDALRSSISSIESFFSSPPTPSKETATLKDASLQSPSSLMMKWQNNNRPFDHGDEDDDFNSSLMILETPPPPSPRPREAAAPAPVAAAAAAAAGRCGNGIDNTGGGDDTTLHDNQGRSVSSFEMPPMIPDW